jgi:hypothetical protein
MARPRGSRTHEPNQPQRKQLPKVVSTRLAPGFLFAGLQMDYIAGILSSLTQLGNAMLCGHPKESISARSWREPWPRVVAVIDALFFWQPNHCRRSYEASVHWARQHLDQHHQREVSNG